jgi:hypothetical protein
MCALHRVRGEKERGFLGLASKSSSMVSPGLASKPLAWFSQFGPQNRQLRFGDLAHKITTTVSWFGPQNLVGYGLSVVPQNQREAEDGVGHMSKSSGLLRLEVNQARVS